MHGYELQGEVQQLKEQLEVFRNSGVDMIDLQKALALVVCPPTYLGCVL